MSMTIQVPIPDDMIPRLEQKARSAGLDLEQYVRALVSRELAGPRTFDEILGGFREEVTASGRPGARHIHIGTHPLLLFY